jgi:amino-acid N-acetyltransferase
MKARRARFSDAEAIHALVAGYAAQGLLLPRALAEIQGNFAHFLVIEEKQRLLGCVALETYGAELAEIRSLAVAAECRGRGLGVRLIQFALTDARRRRIARVFAVTHAPEFFLRQGFAMGSRHSLTEKIERDCNACPKQLSCRLLAVIATVLPERIALPVLGDCDDPVPVA